MKTVLYANDSSYGGISFIANHIPNANTILAMSVRKDFDKMFNDLTYISEKEKTIKLFNECEHLVIFSIYSLKYFVRGLLPKTNKKSCSGFKRCTVIISDSAYLTGNIEWNNYIKENNIDVLIMPDLAYLLPEDIKRRYYYQHVPLTTIECDKDIDIAHSPGLKVSTNLKGTKDIKTILKNYDLHIISGLDWYECQKRKARAKIFIDQIVSDRPNDYKGGLGKSGIEAMHHKCLTITSGEYVDTSNTFPFPPLVFADKSMLESAVRYYLENEFERKEIAQKQYEWAKKYTSLEFVINNICEKQL